MVQCKSYGHAYIINDRDRATESASGVVKLPEFEFPYEVVIQKLPPSSLIGRKDHVFFRPAFQQCKHMVRVMQIGVEGRCAALRTSIDARRSPTPDATAVSLSIPITRYVVSMFESV